MIKGIDTDEVILLAVYGIILGFLIGKGLIEYINRNK
jgi:hypothetical protein